MTRKSSSTYRYTLRFGASPESFNQQRADSLQRLIIESGIDDVAVFLNQEEVNDSHITIERAQELVAFINKDIRPLLPEDVTLSLNPWTTLNHSDRGLALNPNLNITPMVNYRGVVSQSMACPGDLSWQNYISRIYAIYASIKPYELWLEDDFRHYKNWPFELTCFCSVHMAEYNRRLNQHLSRAEFVKALLQDGPNSYREVYLEVAQEEILHVAHLIEQRVHKVSPETILGLMSSDPEIHALENRDWSALLQQLSGEYAPAVLRPHLPAYNEVSPQQYARKFSKITEVSAELTSDYANYPELENYMYSPYAKSKDFTRFQLETTALVNASGILMNLFDMNGNGVNLTYGYQNLLRSEKPFMNFLKSKEISWAQRLGIIVPYQQEAVANVKHTNQTISGLKAHQTEWISLLNCFGISATVHRYDGQIYRDETLALSGDFIDTLKSHEIQSLITNNRVLLDGSAIVVLKKRNLLKLIQAQNVEVIPNRSGKQAFEQLDGQTIAGIINPRVSLLTHIGDYVKIDYQSDIKANSYAYDRYANKVGPMVVERERQFIFPVLLHPKYGWEAEYTDIREISMKRYLEKSMATSFLIEMPNCQIQMAKGSKLKMFISNWSHDSVPIIQFYSPRTILSKEVQLYSRKNQDVSKQQVTLIQDRPRHYRIEESVPAMSVLYITDSKE